VIGVILSSSNHNLSLCAYSRCWFRAKEQRTKRDDVGFPWPTRSACLARPEHYPAFTRIFILYDYYYNHSM